MESREEKLLHALFGESEPKAKALKFSLNLDDVTVDVSIKRNEKEKVEKCSQCKCGGKRQ
jgi:hypothetical protein